MFKPSQIKRICLYWGFGAAIFGLATGCSNATNATKSAPVSQESPVTTGKAIDPAKPAPAGQESPGVAANSPSVVATYSVLCDLTEKIAQNTVKVNCLIPAGGDPHVYQPKPEDKRTIENANLVLYGGYNFETNLLKVLQSTSSKGPKVAVSEKATPQPIKNKHDHGHGHEDDDHKHNHGDDHNHGEFDPHVWHDAQNGIRMVNVIRDQLKTLVPDQASLYDANAQRLTEQIQRLDTWIKAQVNTIPAGQRRLVTTHEALGYYAQAYGLQLEGALKGVTTEEQPTAKRVAELVKVIKDAKVPVIFAEASVNPGLINTVAKEANVRVSSERIFADGLGAPPANTYVGMLAANTCTIVNGLGGKCTPFQ